MCTISATIIAFASKCLNWWGLDSLIYMPFSLGDTFMYIEYNLFLTLSYILKCGVIICSVNAHNEYI